MVLKSKVQWGEERYRRISGIFRMQQAALILGKRFPDIGQQLPQAAMVIPLVRWPSMISRQWAYRSSFVISPSR